MCVSARVHVRACVHAHTCVCISKYIQNDCSWYRHVIFINMLTQFLQKGVAWKFHTMVFGLRVPQNNYIHIKLLPQIWALASFCFLLLLRHVINYSGNIQCLGLWPNIYVSRLLSLQRNHFILNCLCKNEKFTVFNSAPCHEDADGKWRYSFIQPLPWHQTEVNDQLH